MALLRRLFGDDALILRQRDFQALLLANILPPLGSALLSPILQSLIEPLDTSPGDVGLLIAVFTAPPIVMIPIMGALSDRYGRKPILVVSLLLFGVAGSAIAFTTEFRIVLGLRFLQGISYGGITPIIITSIGDIYDETAEATAQGIRFTSSGLSQTVFPLLAGGLVVIAWQYPFLLYAMAMPIAAIVYCYFDEPTAGASAVETALHDGGSQDSYLRALFELTRQPRVLALVIARALPVIVWIAFLTYNSIVVVQVLSGTPTQAGILVALGSLAYATGASQAGRLTTLLDSRFALLIGGNGCLGIGFALFLFAPSLPLAGVGIALSGIGFGLLLGLYRSIVTGLASEALRGGLVSLSESLGRTVATITPVVMGGFITIATPSIGIITAIQSAGIGAATISSVGGIICLIVANDTPPVRPGG